MNDTHHIRSAALRAFAALLATGGIIAEAHPGHFEHAAGHMDSPPSGTWLLICTAVALLAAGSRRLFRARTGGAK